MGRWNDGGATATWTGPSGGWSRRDSVAVTRLSAPVPVSPHTHTGQASLSDHSLDPCLASN